MSMVIKLVSGKLECKSAGLIVRNKERKYLLIDRYKYGSGWACPSGHVEQGEDSRRCAVRETREETGLAIHKHAYPALAKLFHQDVFHDFRCKRGNNAHEFCVYGIFEAETYAVELREPGKHRGIGWFSPEEMRHLNLEPMWRTIFKAQNII